MGWPSDRWRAFSHAAGHRRYVLGSLVAIVLGGFDWIRPWLGNFPTMTGLVGFPSLVVGVIVAILLVAYWLLERVVYLENRIYRARGELARLRRKGVELRNEGRHSITTKAKWEEWQPRAAKWNKDVILSLKDISEADAEWFAVLDVVPSPRLPPENAPRESPEQEAFLKLYKEHDFRVKRLGEMVYSLWGK